MPLGGGASTYPAPVAAPVEVEVVDPTAETRSVTRRDLYHPVVKAALIKDGWTITHDPLVVSFGIHNLYVDLGAERMLEAERSGERIAVEIKSFVGHSAVADMQQALGQYLMYRSLLRRRKPDLALVLAVPADAFDAIFGTDLGRAILEDYAPIVLVFDSQREVIRQWVR